MIDGNNMHHNDGLFGGSGKGGILNTENSRMPSGRRMSIASGGEYPGIPLPSVLKANHEVLMLIAGGETQAVITMFKSMEIKEVVGIRGLNL